MNAIKVKVCGLSTPAAVEAAIRAGADYVGLVFFEKSPRNVTVKVATQLAGLARAEGVSVVAVTVDAPSNLLDEISALVAPDLYQLHGSETPQRLDEVRAITGAKLIRALRIASAADLDAASDYGGAADYLMFDAKAPAGAVLPGGNGAAFDWSLLRGRHFQKPWFLAGGLTSENVVEAIQTSGSRLLDVSSGVESAPGVKDPVLIKAFLEAIRRVETQGEERRLKS